MFKVGDKVQYIGQDNIHFNKWAIYEVESIITHSITRWDMFVFDNNNSPVFALFSEFRLVISNDNEDIVSIADNDAVKTTIEVDYFKITHECSNL